MKNEVKGFSLIEVLVSLVILVIGLIGIFNLHIVSKRSSFESFQQTQASYYVNDIINRMKLNRTQLINYSGTFSGALSAPSTSCDVAAGAAAVVCSNVETRLWDLYQWEQLFGGSSERISGRDVGGLDTPTACIQIQATGEVLVVMTWRGIRNLSDGTENATGDGAAFIKSCGTASDRRRAYSINTVII
ncbi:type IV pilus modification protein PilV [Shewanella hanedai]|jgi:type IV pilus assembly protein PilV|uniref:Type IV pilus modification protein PilV n=1 Tax=Shewanella hanedai TaxID=25 RepID=A0A553JIL3_SHEHA|nr:type IV pilus modification protein PilV [Shewanella hanedai]TRY12301.1 type IV pilus modification protein PilV [Shewanella hanedai]GGI99228.1 type IV pilus modification protein PilV [Shewanella hanedai]